MCRDFVLTQYQHLKKANPKFPILIRECSGVEARLTARYGENVPIQLSLPYFMNVLCKIARRLWC